MAVGSTKVRDKTVHSVGCCCWTSELSASCLFCVFLTGGILSIFTHVSNAAPRCRAASQELATNRNVKQSTRRPAPTIQTERCTCTICKPHPWHKCSWAGHPSRACHYHAHQLFLVRARGTPRVQRMHAVAYARLGSHSRGEVPLTDSPRDAAGRTNTGSDL